MSRFCEKLPPVNWVQGVIAISWKKSRSLVPCTHHITSGIWWKIQHVYSRINIRIRVSLFVFVFIFVIACMRGTPNQVPSHYLSQCWPRPVLLHCIRRHMATIITGTIINSLCPSWLSVSDTLDMILVNMADVIHELILKSLNESKLLSAVLHWTFLDWHQLNDHV